MKEKSTRKAADVSDVMADNYEFGSSFLNPFARDYYKARNVMDDDDPLDREIHFTEPGVRGKYARDFARSRNVRILAPDLLDAFPNSESMNEALRAIVEVAKRASAPAPKAVSARRAAAPKSRKKARS